jgi:Tfp pilus assembly protein PilN
LWYDIPMASQNSFDLDSLPEQPQPRKLPRGTIVLWLVAVSGVILLAPLYLASATIRSDITRLEADLQAAHEALTGEETPEPEVQELMNDLAQVQGSVDEIEGAYSGVAAGHANWPAIIAAIGNYNPSQLALTSITQSDSQITLNGRAINDATVIAYSRALEESNLFSRVVVQSVRSVATPFASPTSTAVEPSATPLTPTATVTSTVTPTPVPDLADEYEVDDFTPKVIFLGQVQSHSFHPIYDVDKVKFLAKAGRYYRVSTADLSPGVDTFLTVVVGGTTYTNDDREPGLLSSEVMFLVRAGSDVETIVKVTNRGQYGPDSWYQLIAEEVVPTPTPTPTSIPTSTPTNTPSPSATPENTPTPTPDLRDGYEPDDTDPQPISIGETQKHNFYPDNDVDKVEFLAKSGRYYRVFTSNLTPGVDTFLTVRIGDSIYTNDDRDAGREPGDLSSEIVFQVKTGDISALVEVTNRRQYGSDKWYQITVEETVPTPTPTPTNTPPPTEAAPPSSSSSSSRCPGVASPAFGFAFADPRQVTVRRTAILAHPSASRYGGASGVFSSEAVEFVIVLELKTGSP